MSKFVFPGTFPFSVCIPKFKSIEYAYGNPGSQYVLRPLEMPLKYAMALFWRVKGYNISGSIDVKYPFPEPPISGSLSCDSTLIADLPDYPDPPEDEMELICRQSLFFQGFTEGEEISCSQSFILQEDGIVSFTAAFFTIEGNQNIFWRYYNVGLIGAGPDLLAVQSFVDTDNYEVLGNTASFKILDRTFQLMILKQLFSADDIAGNISIEANDYWPYANDDGSSPTYNTTTGERIGLAI